MQLQAAAVVRPLSRVRGRNPLDISKGRGCLVLVQIEEEKIRHRKVIEPFRNGRMLPDTVERIAKNDTRADVGVVQWLHAHVVTSQEQALLPPIPDGEGEISK